MTLQDVINERFYTQIVGHDIDGAAVFAVFDHDEWRLTEHMTLAELAAEARRGLMDAGGYVGTAAERARALADTLKTPAQ